MHSTSLLGLLKEFRGQILQNFIPLAECLIFLNVNFGFGLMSEINFGHTLAWVPMSIMPNTMECLHCSKNSIFSRLYSWSHGETLTDI